MWAAVTVVAAAYVMRSMLRGGDFRPDMPMDAVFAAVLAVLLIGRIALARSSDPEEVGDGVAGTGDGTGGANQKDDC